MGEPHIGGDQVTARRAKKQHGAAILIAMLVVTLVATMAQGMQWRQWRVFQQELVARAQSQAAWVLVGTIDWTRLVLREDARSSGIDGQIDHLGEPWALPLQEVKLSSFLAVDAQVDVQQNDAYLSGKVTDAQAKINLGQADLSPTTLESLRRLYTLLGLPEKELFEWTAAWKVSLPAAAPQGNQQIDANKSLQPRTVEQLVWLGLPAKSLEILKEHLVILPEPTMLNLNTANAITMAAAIPFINLTAAQKIVQSRTNTPLKNLTQVQALLGTTNVLDAMQFGVSTQYFEVRGRLRIDDWVFEEVSLVLRKGIDVTTVWRKRV